ncbi:hypothetical protein GH714_008373 [Hevea brasiliensis]|uniref:Kinesin-like protein n=1 Tax=Hevea brasiliensis TaxID=3981 RepID=A0A6A6KAG6_HEVBR|nr:hypothetical protein GH714_008373 [Hevea brasiliensis]
MTSCRLLEVHTEDQTPHKWSVSLTEELFKKLFSQGTPILHKIFGEGSLFSPLLFGKFFDPSDAFPLWEFESDILLSNLRSSGKTSVDWFQTDEAYVLKAELPGVGINTVRVYAENGKIVEISGQWKQQKESKAKDWRSEHWWEHGYVRRLELPEDADWKKIQAYNKYIGDEVPVDKWQQLGVDKMVGTATNGRLRQAFSIERCDNMMDYIKRLRLCIKWFQELEGFYLFEQEKLQNALEFTESRCADMEIMLKNKEEELNLIIVELRKSLSSLQEKVSKEESEKLIIAVNDMYKLLQEYNSSLQLYNSKLQTDLETAHETVKHGEKEKAAIVESLSHLRGQHQSLQDQHALCKASLEEVTKQKDALVNEVADLRGELQQVRNDHDQYQSQVQELMARVVNCEELAVKSNELEERYLSQSNQLRTLQEQLEVAQNKLRVSDMSAFETRTEFEELKGNIRVFCRVRPPLPDDIPCAEGKAKIFFTFDQVFTPDASQEDVFVEISQLVQSALDGYKVCIFAYGQTGSGKTYTMMGKPGHPEQKGLIPRSLEQIFQTRQSLLSQGWTYEMQVSMLEIYNETIRDLLLTNRDLSRIENGTSGKQYAIKHDANGNTHVSDLTIVDVRSTREVSFLLDQAANSRSVGKTQMNEQSSRSHFVFTLRISGINESTDQQVQGVLNLIDLAGSERLSKSGSTGDRLKETQAINKSLSSLSDVIFALAKKEDHVPFRHSKLTYLLQPCLGGDSKTLMFVNISPDPSSLGESLCSLRFAARVNACEIGIPRRHTIMRSTDSRLSLADLIRHLFQNIICH